MKYCASLREGKEVEIALSCKVKIKDTQSSIIKRKSWVTFVVPFIISCHFALRIIFIFFLVRQKAYILIIYFPQALGEIKCEDPGINP